MMFRDDHIGPVVEREAFRNIFRQSGVLLPIPAAIVWATSKTDGMCLEAPNF